MMTGNAIESILSDLANSIVTDFNEIGNNDEPIRIEMGKTRQSSIEFANDLAIRLQLPIRLRFEEQEADSEYTSAFNMFKTGKYKSVPDVGQVATALMVIFLYLAYRGGAKIRCEENRTILVPGHGRSVIINGVPQFGKTLILAMLYFLLPAIEFLFYRRTVYPIVVSPSVNNISKDTYNEIMTFKGLFGDLVMDSLSNNSSISIKAIANHLTNELSNVATGSRLELRDLIMMRNRKYLKRIQELATTKPTGVLMLIDEPHHGSGRGSVHQRMNYLLQQLHGMSCENGIYVRRVAIDATPSQLEGHLQWIKVSSILPSNYCGITAYNKVVFTTIDGKPCVKPELRSLEKEYSRLWRAHCHFVHNTRVIRRKKRLCKFQRWVLVLNTLKMRPKMLLQEFIAVCKKRGMKKPPTLGTLMNYLDDRSRDVDKPTISMLDLKIIDEAVKSESNAPCYYYVRLENDFATRSEELGKLLLSDCKAATTTIIKYFAKVFHPELKKLFDSAPYSENNVVFVRFSRTISTSKCLLKALAEEAGNDNNCYSLERYFGTPLPNHYRQFDGTTKSIKCVCYDKYLALGKRVVVLATDGRSNYGDSYLPSTKYYFDWWERNAADWNTLVQGTYGRAMGRGKRSIIFMPASVVEALERFCNRDGYDESRGFDARTKYIADDDCMTRNRCGSIKISLCSYEGSGFRKPPKALQEKLYQILYNNLNGKFKRLAANIEDHLGADDELYNALDRGLLNEIQEWCGYIIPDWGSAAIGASGQKVIFGKTPKGEIAPFGLRKGYELEDFASGRDVQTRVVDKAGAGVGVFKPQIAYTATPTDLFKKFDRPDLNGKDNLFKIRSGGKTASYRLDEGKIKLFREWDDLCIIPLALWLPRIGRIHVVKSTLSQVKADNFTVTARPNSLFHDADDDYCVGTSEDAQALINHTQDTQRLLENKTLESLVAMGYRDAT